MTSEERRRALDSLVQIAGRMRYLGVLVLRDKPDLPKLAGELEGMAAWVCAFARVIAGEPSGVLEGEPEHLELVALRAQNLEAAGWLATTSWPSEGIESQSEPLPSCQIALAVAITSLALRLCERGASTRSEAGAAESQLAQRLGQALSLFVTCDLVPELNAHGMPEDG